MGNNLWFFNRSQLVNSGGLIHSVEELNKVNILKSGAFFGHLWEQSCDITINL